MQASRVLLRLTSQLSRPLSAVGGLSVWDEVGVVVILQELN